MYFHWVFIWSKKCIAVNNPITCKIRVSRDVVFDELSSWYGTQKFMHVDVEKEEVQEKGQQEESQV